jgi:hypothetical protein
VSRRAVFVILAAGVLGSCSTKEQEKKPPPRVEDENAALGGDVAAHVGDERIPLAIVKSVAQKHQIAPRDAARRLIDDAIAAHAARQKGLDRQPPASWLLVAARGRFAADKIFEEARKGGLPTDEEVNILTEIYWHEVDRPPTVRVVHAVAQPFSPAHEAAAQSVAADIRKAVESATSGEEFLTKAKTVIAPQGVNVTIQPLPSFTEEGWSPEAGTSAGQMDIVFAKASFRLPSIGATSEVVKTKFGYHVIRLVERIPEHRVPFATRRMMFTDEALKLRAKNATKARLDALRAIHRVEISASAETIMRAVPIREQ